MAKKGEVRWVFVAETGQWQQATAKMERGFLGLTGKAEKFAKVMAAGLGAAAAVSALKRVGSAVVQNNIEFERLTTQIKTLTVGGEADLKRFNAQLVQMSSATATGPQELAKALFFVESAGVRGAAALDVTQAAAQAAKIGLGDAATIARTVVSAMNAYGEANLGASEAVDKLIEIVRQGGAEATEYASSLGKVLPVAANLGVTFEEVGGFLAVFTRQGVPAAEAVSSLRGAMVALSAPGTEAAKTMEGLGISAEHLRGVMRDDGLAAALREVMDATGGNIDMLKKIIPRVEGLVGVLAVAGGQADEYRAAVDAIGESHGNLEDAVEQTADTLGFQWDRMMAIFEASTTDASSGWLGLFKETLEAVANVMERIGNNGLQYGVVETRGLDEWRRQQDASARNRKIAESRAQVPAQLAALGMTRDPFDLGSEAGFFNEAKSAMAAVAVSAEKTKTKTKEARVEVWELMDGVMTLPRAVDLTTLAFTDAEMAVTNWRIEVQELPAAIDHTASVFGEKVEEAEKATIDWHQALQDVANQFSLLGGTAGEVLAGIAGGIAGIGAGVGTFKAGQKAGGIGGFFAQVSGALGIAGAAVGIGKAIVGLFQSDPVEDAQKEAGKYLGMNISKELAEQFVKQAEQTGQSIEAVAQQWFDQMKQALRDEGMSMAMEGLAAQVDALGDAPQYAEVAARNFNSVFWEVVKDQGLPAALEAFKDIYSKLRQAFGDELPPGFGGLAKLFKLMEDPAIAAQLQVAQGQAQFVGGATRAGFYDPSMTQDSVNIANDTLDTLRQQGVNDQQAFQMTSSLLQAELNAAIASGRQIDGRLQALLDEARANGVQILPGIAEQQLDVLRKIYTSVSGGRRYVPPGGGPAVPGAGARPGTYVPGSSTPVLPPSYKPNGGDYTRMAEGGIVTRPTHALIGEAGPEAVMPLGDVTGELRGLRSDLARQPMVISKAVRDAVLLSGR